ncbi:hypothetical protein FQN50_006743 [Emmonsiellopsis sp. PD_5]|nr:hypothetical protein FQN50_006743 [Emmonsiellopsis sp. PD_5]
MPESLAAFRGTTRNELTSLAQEHMQHDLHPADRSKLKQAASKLGTHAQIGSVLGVGLGLFMAYRIRRLRVDTFNAFRVAEKPTHIQFANGRLAGGQISEIRLPQETAIPSSENSPVSKAVQSLAFFLVAKAVQTYNWLLVILVSSAIHSTAGAKTFEYTMSQPSKWGKTKGYSKRGFDKAWHALDKLGRPINRLSNKVGAESFWPTTMDKESDKAARILRSFCKDGFYADEPKEEQDTERPGSDRASEEREDNNKEDGQRKESIDRPRGKQRVVKKIPAEVIKQAKGLAIFTTMRTGLWISGAGGSGILVARVKETGEWSPPSGIMLHTSGIGFLVGVDIYDCVVVINTYEALEAFKAVRCTLGGEISAVAGPVGMGGVVESEVHKRRAPVWTYLKSRGFYAGVQVDGTIVIERSDENERFYGEKIPVGDILAGKAKNPPSSIRTLMQTIKAAQGDTDVDEDSLPPPGDAPGDAEIDVEVFDVPDPDDPDPFGVKALEREGVIIREAGTKRIPSMDMFEFRPSPTSPIYANFPRLSTEGSQRASWRTSVLSASSTDRATQTDICDERPATASTSISRASSSRSFKDTATSPSVHVTTQTGVSTRAEDTSPSKIDEPSTTRGSLVVHDQTALEDPSRSRPTSPSFTRARLVTIPKRAPPPLPPRSESRVTSPGSSHSESRERAHRTSISGYDDDIEIFEVHDGSNGNEPMKAISIKRTSSNEEERSQEEPAPEQGSPGENQPSGMEESHEQNPLVKENSREGGPTELEPSTEKGEPRKEGESPSNTQPAKTEEASEEEISQEDKALESLNQLLQNGFTQDENEEFHSMPSPTGSTTDTPKKKRNKKSKNKNKNKA